ncbi:mCG144694, partial [Mus musculus]
SQHLGGRGRRISEFEASLVYKVSSRTARAIQRNPVSKRQKKKTKQKGDSIIYPLFYYSFNIPISPFFFSTPLSLHKKESVEHRFLIPGSWFCAPRWVTDIKVTFIHLK